MPKTKLGSMSVEQLLRLRHDVGKELNRKSTELRSQLVGRGALAQEMRNIGIKANDNVKTGLVGEHSQKSEVDADVEEPSVEPDSRTVIYFELLNRRRVLTGPQTRQMKGIGRIE